MSKKMHIGVFATVILLMVFLSGTTEVNAANVTGRRYETWMQISDNSLMTGTERLFYSGAMTIDISFDAWNSSICTKNTDSSYVTINLYDNLARRTVAYKSLRSRLGTCAKANFGNFGESRYYHYFMTFDTQQTKYCGYRSNNVIMQSE